MSGGPITLSMAAPGLSASLAGLAQVADAFAEAAKLVLDFLDVGGEFTRVERCAAAGGAGKLSVTLQPTDRYLEMVAAVRAVDAEGGIVEEVLHGWPVLSFVTPDANVAEAEADCIRPGGGAA